MDSEKIEVKDTELTTDKKDEDVKDEDIVIVEPTMGLCEACKQLTSDTDTWCLTVWGSIFGALSGIAMVLGFTLSFKYGIQWLNEIYIGPRPAIMLDVLQATTAAALDPQNGVSMWDKNCDSIMALNALYANRTSLPGAAPIGTAAPVAGATINMVAENLVQVMPQNAYYILAFFLVFGVIAALTQSAQMYCFGKCGLKAATHVRVALYEAYLEQEMGFHDKYLSHVLNAKIASEPPKIQSGLTGQAGFFWAQFATALAGFGYAFYESSEFSLVLLALLPALLFSGGVQGVILANSMGSGSGDDKWSSSLGRAGESLNGLKTVLSINARKASMRLYAKEVEEQRKDGMCFGWKIGFGMGLFFFSMFFVVYGVGLWYGTYLVGECKLSSGEVMGGFFAFMFGGMGLAQMATAGGQVAGSLTAAASCYAIIKRKPLKKMPDAEIHENGLMKGIGKGRIELKNVDFAYPTRPDNYVFKNFSLTIEPGMTVAFVGHSGCGKSTIVNLLERFYDPINGEILIDGTPIHNFNVEYLRKHLSMVGQEPVLFDMTVEENISLGTTEEATFEQIESAAKRANAYNFIDEFPDKFETSTGEKGAQMSGGQKQRIAIARAIMKQPKILLLDEATSALDTESEKVVQAALDKLIQTENCTCIVIAHRLSTIKDADMIVVMDHGKIIEKGSHTELIGEHGVYYQMVNQQIIMEETSQGLDIKMLRQQSSASIDQSSEQSRA